jgi:signal peptidase I
MAVRELVLALVVATVFRTALAEPYQVPTGSMIPTLLEGDELIAAKYAYGYSRYSLPFGNLPGLVGRILKTPPARGDVVVFRLPRDASETYVKRLVGLPGDRIQMRDGALYINDQRVQLQRIDVAELFYHGMPHRVTRYLEVLPGGTPHEIIKEGDNRPLDNTEAFTVPSGHYFMMGDNRDDSIDSRVPESAGGVGFVPEDNLVGRVDRLAFSRDLEQPWWHFLGSIRTDRILAAIR